MFRTKRALGRLSPARLATGLLMLMTALSPLASSADGLKVGPIGVDHAWSRATPPGATTGAGYFELLNGSPADDRLVSVTSLVAAKIQIHEMKVENGVMTMRSLADGLAIPAGKEVALKPSGYHLMLIDLKRPLKAGEEVPVTLTFAKAGKVDIALHVEKLGASGPSEQAGGGMQGHTTSGHDMNGMSQ